jgi:hypothetical protein
MACATRNQGAGAWLPATFRLENYLEIFLLLRTKFHQWHYIYISLHIQPILQDAGRATFMEKYYAFIAFALIMMISPPEY